MRETASGRLRERTNVGVYSSQTLRLNREGLVILGKNCRQMRRVLRTELNRLLKVIQRLKSQSRTASNQTLTRMQALRNRLSTGPVLALLPDWWQPR